MTVPSDYDPRAFPPFAVTVDIVVFTIDDGALQVAMIERGVEPHKGALALPGGFVLEDGFMRTSTQPGLGVRAL